MPVFFAVVSVWVGALMAQPTSSEPLVFSAEDFETTVYFDYGREDLGPAGVLLIEQQAQRALAAGFNKATVTGHTDKAGPEDQNYRDGLARAQAVAEVLIASGYSTANVDVESAGETEPARNHDDERREPLNRRAVITFDR